MTGHGTLSLAIVSGKGGVGKTNTALNLAYALYRTKQRVLLMDCDLGLANINVLLGIAPRLSIEHIMHGEASFSDTVVAVEPGGFSLLPASSGIDFLGDSSSPVRSSFLCQLNAFARNYDYLILDVGAGITNAVQGFAMRAAARIVVVTPEPTSLIDAYALIKVLASVHKVADFHVLVNMAETAKEEKASFNRLAAACKKFLNISIHSLGCIRTDPAVNEAVLRQQPLLKFAPSSQAGKDFVTAATRVRELRETLELDPTEPLKVALKQHT